MVQVCPNTVKFAIAESIGQLFILRPHPNEGVYGDGVGGASSAGSAMQCLGSSLLIRVHQFPSLCQSDFRCEEQSNILTKQ